MNVPGGRLRVGEGGVAGLHAEGVGRGRGKGSEGGVVVVAAGADDEAEVRWWEQENYGQGGGAEGVV